MIFPRTTIDSAAHPGLAVTIALLVLACGGDAGSAASRDDAGGAPTSDAGGRSGSSLAGADHAGTSGGGAGGTTGVGTRTNSAGWAGIADDCRDELARGITIHEVALFQAGKIPVMQDGTAVPARTAEGAEIIQGKDALFRVAVRVDRGFRPRELSARLWLNQGSLGYHARTRIAASSRELDASNAFHLTVPGSAITSSLDYRIEIVECDTGSGTAHQPRFPVRGTAPLNTRRTGLVKITMLPVTSGGVTPVIDEAFADELKAVAEAMYPTTGIEVTLDDTPVGDCNITAENARDGDAWGNCGDILRSRRASDQPPADVYYVGILRPEPTYEEYCRDDCYNGYSLIGSVDAPEFRVAVLTAYLPHVAEVTFPHELGHSHGLYHAAGCDAGTPDPSYPYISEGTSHIGWVGWNRLRPGIEFLEPEQYPEFMSYCSSTWISDYTFRRIADRIAGIANARIMPGPPRTWRVLLESARSLRWGIPITSPTSAAGEPAPAAALRANGEVVCPVTVYRIPTSLGGAVYLVPDPEDGWSAISVNGHTLAF